MRINRMLQIIALAVMGVTLAAASARADSFNVTLNTSSLSGTQILAFGFNDGDGVADNAVMLSAFTFGGGSAVTGTEDCTLGGALSGAGCSGNLTSGVTLDDTGFTAFFDQQFNAGSSLSFNKNTTNSFAGGTPDNFAMYVCDSTLTTCYSDDTSTASMLVLNLTGGTLAPSDFILNGASDQNLPAPVVTEGSTSTPEPGSLLLLGAGVAGVAPVLPAAGAAGADGVAGVGRGAAVATVAELSLIHI